MAVATKAALKRADSALAGAAAFLFACVAYGAVNGSGTDELAMVPIPSAKPAIVTQAPIELAAADLAAERRCLADAIFHEARGEGVDGQKAVAEVVMQRIRDRNYPNTICGVVYQGSHLKTGCQFSFTCDGSLKHSKNPFSWKRARLTAAKILAGTIPLDGITDRATHFHTVWVQPVWADTLLKTATIGNHIFYRRAPRERES